MIRPMVDADVDAVSILEEQLFPGDCWDRRQFLYELHENPFAKLFVIEKDGIVNGYCDLWIMYEQAQIANIAVSASCQRQGFGQMLMDHMCAQSAEQGCEYLSLEVRLSNQAAVHLYEKNGFIKASKRKGYYSDGEDAWLMVKPVGGSNDTDSRN
ncbi:MAG: ribosomal protein S18-alanine N-acetyltransferase [Erysipelotrichaceae bacterium]|jgi:ribosomal-protein-alanine N-acetyltransferase|nr:ribosomal protein S18-alanine N-acetyltransferase [Erysipelotrichaceae bacterium]MCI1326547.1 ribosomal protein S18-alanine N-acetyltransferase [Solobacterium sp.]MCH4044525.1 ribosomal protein S18-alanine N-acetyltransferase [Erysipelotrichaceae bacterium]MCH4121737.1 ribosomal protein S18-alanine N-acetyltransferase [Erysipelotrichaceae bacterium]MCI1385137.1 ribosomal protein S18-alanine N-acetyltransferase [Solobacterium sp.]